MLINVEHVENLRGLARARARDFTTQTIHPADTARLIEEGWTVDRKSSKSVRVKRTKRHDVLLEDRVWTLLYRMGFDLMSGKGGGRLTLDTRQSDGPASQLDVVAVDDETALAIECKSAERWSKRPQFQEELGKFALTRERFSASVMRQFSDSGKRQIGMAMFVNNIMLSDNDRARARDANVMIFDAKDLQYYEDLVSHLGPAAKYQFLADLFPGKRIPGLQLKVPAIKSKMGGHTCYTFSISPEYLLKIAYVSHRAKGKASDVDTYQRMIRKSRLTKIRKYIDEDGVFPTNIVVNFDKTQTFERGPQETTDQDAGMMGWLVIRPTYKSAWIIDGQHRLFAYSGHARARKACLSVLAFEGLQPSHQAEMFVRINAEQKSVKQSHLQEMYAELKWDSDKLEDRVSAIVSKAIQSANADPDSPFYQRILGTDEKKDSTCCITLGSMFRALEVPEFFVLPTKKAGIVEYGPLWALDSEATRKRTVYVLNGWFRKIRDFAGPWWDAGSGDGGGLAMNDGVTACLNVLRSVFQHVSNGSNITLATLADDELLERIDPYSEALARYLGSLSEDERLRFRELRGIQGITARTRKCQQAIHEQIASFNPPGLQEFLATEKAQTNTRAKAIVDEIETTLQKAVLEELRGEFTLDESQWWVEGVPKTIRMKVAQRHEDDDGKRGGREYYFDLLDYRHIIQNNWELFGPLLGYTKAGASKEKRTKWIDDVNEVRRIVAHVSAGRSVSLEQLGMLETYRDWLALQVSGGDQQSA